jgi:putative ABC transport system permease protein
VRSGCSRFHALDEPSAEGGGGTISTQDAAIIENEPGIRRDTEGRPMASGIFVVFFDAHKKSDGSRISIWLAGEEPERLRVNSGLKLTAGRMFRTGLHELIVGKTRYTEDRGMAIGDRVWVRGDYWTVVGHFEGNPVTDSGLLTDANTLMSAARGNNFARILVTVDPGGGFARLQQTLTANPALHVELKHQSESNLDDMKPITRLLDFVSYFVGAVMAAGATFGAVNALYALIDQRRRDMATLRAIGFGGGPIVAAVLIESMLMALPGAVLGAIAAWALFNRHHISPVGLSFDLAVTPELAVIGIVWALAMGVLGGLIGATQYDNAGNVDGAGLRSPGRVTRGNGGTWLSQARVTLATQWTSAANTGRWCSKVGVGKAVVDSRRFEWPSRRSRTNSDIADQPLVAPPGAKRARKPK